MQWILGTILRIGIALVGLRLTLQGLAGVGTAALAVVAACITTALLVSTALARMLGLSSAMQRLLFVGSAVCGCTAIVATSPAIKARPVETGAALTCVVLIGSLGMLLYPWLAAAVFDRETLPAGIFLGSAIHDTSQVIGASLIYAQQFGTPDVVGFASATKLFRNLWIVILVPLLAWSAQPRAAATEDPSAMWREPIVIVDGLTKNFRYPGWRVGWIVGPSAIIEQVVRAASSIDGGPPATVQCAALAVLNPQRADQETHALRIAFARKRKLMLDVLIDLGVRVPHRPRGTFYIWGDIAALAAPYNDAESLFRAALERKVMVVPGRFFDVNPDGRRAPDPSYDHWVRFSFGPPEHNVKLGLKRLQQLLGRRAM